MEKELLITKLNSTMPNLWISAISDLLIYDCDEAADIVFEAVSRKPEDCNAHVTALAQLGNKDISVLFVGLEKDNELIRECAKKAFEKNISLCLLSSSVDTITQKLLCWSSVKEDNTSAELCSSLLEKAAQKKEQLANELSSIKRFTNDFRKRRNAPSFGFRKMTTKLKIKRGHM